MKKLIIWTIIIGGVAYAGSKFYLHREVEKSVDTAILMMSPLATIEYGGISSTMSGELTIDDIHAKIAGFKDEIVIDRLGIDTPSYFSLLELGEMARNPGAQSGGLPRDFGFIIEGIRAPVEADYAKMIYAKRLEMLGVSDAGEAANECVGKYGFSPTALKSMGYIEEVVSMSITARNGDGDFVLEIVSTAEDMWKIEASLAMAGDLVTEITKGRGYVPKMRHFNASVTDLSLNRRVEKYCASRGLSPEETMTARMDAFKFIGESNGIVFDEYLLEPYQQFLAGEPKITFTAAPNQPISLSQIDLYKPSDVPALLNLSASIP